MNIEDQIKKKAAELEDLLNQAPPGTSAFIETLQHRGIGSQEEKVNFRINVTVTRKVYP